MKRDGDCENTGGHLWLIPMICVCALMVFLETNMTQLNVRIVTFLQATLLVSWNVMSKSNESGPSCALVIDIIRACCLSTQACTFCGLSNELQFMKHKL